MTEEGRRKDGITRTNHLIIFKFFQGENIKSLISEKEPKESAMSSSSSHGEAQKKKKKKKYGPNKRTDQEVFGHRLLRRHALKVLGCSFENPIAPAGPGPQWPQRLSIAAPRFAEHGRVGAAETLVAVVLVMAFFVVFIVVGAAPAAAAAAAVGADATDAEAATPADVTIAARHGIDVRAILAELEDGGDVAAAVAIVRRRPDRHDGRVERLAEALHHELVCACNERYVVHMVEELDNVSTEKETGAARRYAPSLNICSISTVPMELAKA